jgi:hypothetical protein
MRVSWAKRHKSITGNVMPMLRVKSAVRPIVSFAVQRFICVPRKPHDYNVIIVSLFLTKSLAFISGKASGVPPHGR